MAVAAAREGAAMRCAESLRLQYHSPHSSTCISILLCFSIDYAPHYDQNHSRRLCQRTPAVERSKCLSAYPSPSLLLTILTVVLHASPLFYY